MKPAVLKQPARKARSTTSDLPHCDHTAQRECHAHQRTVAMGKKSGRFFQEDGSKFSKAKRMMATAGMAKCALSQMKSVQSQPTQTFTECDVWKERVPKYSIINNKSIIHKRKIAENGLLMKSM